MKLELLSASNFLVHLIQLAQQNVDKLLLLKFRTCLIEILRRRYHGHWFPDKPFKGSSYRCIRINDKMDPIIEQAGEVCGLSTNFLCQYLSYGFIMWINPLEVSYRIGENGRVYILYKQKKGMMEPWQPINISPSNSNRRHLIQINNKNSKKHTLNKIDNINNNSDCNNSLCTMDYLLDPRKSVSIEKLAAYVSL